MGSRSADLEVDEAAVGAVATALGLSLEEGTSRALFVWLEELVRWNRAHDLTAARSRDELLDLMLADAFVLSRSLQRGCEVVDVGTGAGAPGLPLAILRPDLKVTLVEPLQKRASFLRLVLGRLDRLDVTLIAERGESLPEQRWDIAVSRATLAPERWLELGARLVKPGGEVVLLLAREAPPAHEGCELEVGESYEWPRTSAARTMVRYRAAIHSP